MLRMINEMLEQNGVLDYLVTFFVRFYNLWLNYAVVRRRLSLQHIYLFHTPNALTISLAIPLHFLDLFWLCSYCSLLSLSLSPLSHSSSAIYHMKDNHNLQSAIHKFAPCTVHLLMSMYHIWKN